MVRVGRLRYTCEPRQTIGRRIGNMELDGRPIDADRRYKVAGWAPVAENASGEPIWEVVTRYLRDRKSLRAPVPNRPRLGGLDG